MWPSFPALNRFRPSARGPLLLLLALGAVGNGPPIRAAAEAAAASPASPRMLLLDGARIGGELIAVGERGTILRSADEGGSWQRLRSPTLATLTGVSFAAPPPPRPIRRGWAVGHDAVILATEDAGRTWAVQFQGESLQDSFLDVLALDEQTVIAVGAYGFYLATADGGKTWERRRLGPEDTHLNRISQGPAGTLYLAGEAGTLLRSSDRGANWTPLRTPYQGSFYGVMPLDRRTLLAHGLRGRIFRSIDDGDTWQEVTAPAPVLLAAGLQLRSNHLLLAGQSRALLISRDYGRTFSAAERTPGTAIAEMIELSDGRFLALGENGATILPLP